MLWIAAAFGWSFRAELGAQVELASHGIGNAYARHKGWELALITDTLQVRYDHNEKRGRWWLSGRAEFGAVGLMSTRWIDGAPSAEASQLGFYAGPEGGALLYLPRGWYAGVQGSVRYYAFRGLKQTATVADPRALALPELVVGWYAEEADLWVRGGVALSPGVASPGAHLQARLHPGGLFAPWAELRAGVAQNTDLITKTRLGGLNPYVVPLAGAAWAEFWVEDYVAVRVGPRLSVGRQWFAPVLDGAWFDGQQAFGVGTLSHFAWKGWSLDLGVGISPDRNRPDHSWAGSSYFLLGFDF